MPSLGFATAVALPTQVLWLGGCRGLPLARPGGSASERTKALAIIAGFARSLRQAGSQASRACPSRASERTKDGLFVRSPRLKPDRRLGWAGRRCRRGWEFFKRIPAAKECLQDKNNEAEILVGSTNHQEQQESVERNARRGTDPHLRRAFAQQTEQQPDQPPRGTLWQYNEFYC